MPSIQAQVLEALRGSIEAVYPDVKLGIGGLPSENALSLAVAAGRIGAETLAGGFTATLDVTLNSKHENQRSAMDALCAVHETLCGAEPPMGIGWQITALRTASAPAYLEYDGAHWLYGSALSVEYTVDAPATNL